ncbi:MAG: hypothetical protein R8L58_00130 [Mariprofundaceae bacterium]
MKTDLSIRLHRLLFRPRQVIITDAHSRGAARKLYVRPFSFAAVVALAGIGVYAAGAMLSSGNAGGSQQAQVARLQHEQARLTDSITEKEALLSLRDQQIAGLKDEIKDLHQQQTAMQKKLDMFNSILDARKNHGVHLLQANVHRLNDQSIAYSFVLVKGGNYPRTAIGSIRFSTTGPDNQALVLPLSNGEDALPYRTKSHTFMQGTLPWSEAWQPTALRITLLDRRGKEIETRDVNISD